MCFAREVAALQRVAACREVLRLHGWSDILNPATNVLYLAAITDLCLQTLKIVIDDTTFLPAFNVWLDWMHQMSSAMAFLASKGMYHRDLKSDNVLITYDNRAVISDFGLAVTKNTIAQSTASNASGQTATAGYVRGGGGSIGYLAPEAMIRGAVSEASDAYSFGIMVNYMIHDLQEVSLARYTSMKK